MAGNGPAPNPNRRRRNADTYGANITKISPTPADEPRGPTLASATQGQCLTWKPEIQDLVGAWWNRWRLSGQAEIFLDTDWGRLALVAPLVASYYTHPNHLKLAEIRQNESLLGATVVDRLKARIKADAEVEAGTPAGVTALNDYRRNLGAG